MMVTAVWCGRRLGTVCAQVKGLVLGQAREMAGRSLQDMTGLATALNDRSPSLAAFCSLVVGDLPPQLSTRPA